MIQFVITFALIFSIYCWAGRLPGYPKSFREYKTLESTPPPIVCDDMIGNRPFTPLTFPNGSCHDILNPNKGITMLPQIRSLPNTYVDGRGIPLTNLPSAREISNRVVREINPDSVNIKNASRLLIFFGQFLDHDFALILEQPEGEEPEQLENGRFLFPETVSEFLEVEVPLDDNRQQFIDVGELEFGRSEFAIDDSFQRQFLGAITPFIDLSNVYGDSPEVSDAVRAFQAGLLRVDPILLQQTGAEFPPRNEDDMFICGDIRCEENTMLLAFHTIFVRNHNLLARQYLQQAQQVLGLDVIEDDEFIFQQARVRNIIEFQAVFWDQYLPYLLGRRTFQELTGSYQFDPNETPVPDLVFTTAAFRYGHSGVADDLRFIDAAGNPVRNPLVFSDSFFNPDPLFENGQDRVGNIFLGQSSLPHPDLDSRVVDSIRDRLFQDQFPPGFDLVARNIERGRDHGIGFFADFRDQLGLEPIECPGDPLGCFQQLTGESVVAAELLDLYGTLDRCEMWICGMAEKSFEDSLLGETFTVTIAEGFDRMRQSDRLWFENPQIIEDFTTDSSNPSAVLSPVSLDVTLNDIISRNTNVNVPATRNLFMVDPVWLAFAEEDRFQIEWFLAPALTQEAFSNYVIQISPGDKEIVQSRDELLFVLQSESVTPDTEFTATVLTDRGTRIGSTSFRTPGAVVQQNQNNEDDGLSDGAIAGIAVGGFVLLAGLAAGVVLYIRKSNYKRFTHDSFVQ